MHVSEKLFLFNKKQDNLLEFLLGNCISLNNDDIGMFRKINGNNLLSRDASLMLHSRDISSDFSEVLKLNAQGYRLTCRLLKALSTRLRGQVLQSSATGILVVEPFHKVNVLSSITIFFANLVNRPLPFVSLCRWIHFN